jgi:probable rRNA maturation factor
MLSCELSLQIDEPFVSLVDEAQLRKAVEEALIAHGVGSPVELSLVIAVDQVIQELNRTYRGVDEVTDVLAFALGEEAGDFVLPPDGICHLGEVFISYPQAQRQAGEQGHPLERELALLVIHGVLHLLGYDHEHPEAEQRMRAMEGKVLALIFEG